MKLTHRFAVVLIVVVVALAAQGALMAHLGRTNSVQPGKLSAALETLPMTLGDWIGEDKEIEETLRYGDDHLQRLYRNTATGQQLVLWIIYSSEGKDREHHPEVCMQARGLPEDDSHRKTVEAPGHTRPVQQYRFGHTGEQQVVFYWHYRLPSLNAENLDLFQRAYRDSRHPPASLTVEIFAPLQGSESESETDATQFMLALDAQLQEFVGERAIRGNDRKPVTLILTHETPEAAAPPKN